MMSMQMEPLNTLQDWLTPLALLLLAIHVLFFIYFTCRKTSERCPWRPPPSPPGLPLIGNLYQLGPLPHRSMHQLARNHGPVMLLRLGRVPAVVVSTPELAREVMRTHDADCCSRPGSPGPSRLSYGLKDVAFAPYGDYWREMRKLFVVEMLRAKRVQSIWDAREAHVDRMISNLERAAVAARPANLSEEIFAHVDGIIGTTAFGSVYGSEQFWNREHFQHVLDEAMDMMASFSAEDFFPSAVGRLVDRLTGMVARRERCFRDLDAFFQMVIDQHLDPARKPPEQGGGDLVDALIAAEKERNNDGFKFDQDNIKGMILDTFLGGVDTSSVTLLWAMSELIRSPRVLAKAQDELRRVLGRKRRVDPDDLASLSYLKMVVKEALRLHPPATLLLPRETVRATTIGGYDVAAGTRVFVNVWAIGRDPDSWDSPDEFLPERFEGRDVDFAGQHFELVPFGAGRRACPAIAMGAANVEFCLANLLYCFDWTLPEGMKCEDVSMEEEGGLSFHRKVPLCLVPLRYKWHD
ncbi:hypothetical protein GUJ93_ZPchr0013g35397 [Zizania palustris]|uniref:Cytochrome P450 n=1 Tax=Zizania palustris TaxID=103762 RepID=A0A8J5X2H7_ZIZPA|nr:hypothetical protein GUJ93_ZPchr0013g35397 [Zizania palustris]